MATCPEMSCGVDVCELKDRVDGTKRQVHCECSNGGGEATCNSYVTVGEGVATINCNNRCPQSCDSIPVPIIGPTPLVPCFCDN